MEIGSKEFKELLLREGYKIFNEAITDKEGLHTFCQNGGDSLKFEPNQRQLDKGNIDYMEGLVKLVNIFDGERFEYKPKSFGKELKGYIKKNEKKRRLRVENLLEKLPKDSINGPGNIKSKI